MKLPRRQFLHLAVGFGYFAYRLSLRLLWRKLTRSAQLPSLCRLQLVAQRI